jgi:mannitol-specific phosphotransferase system IIBC component
MQKNENVCSIIIIIIIFLKHLIASSFVSHEKKKKKRKKKKKKERKKKKKKKKKRENQKDILMERCHRGHVVRNHSWSFARNNRGVLLDISHMDLLLEIIAGVLPEIIEESCQKLINHSML